MGRILLICLVMICLAGPLAAKSGIDLGVMGGVIVNYSQDALVIPNYDVGNLSLIGGQVYIRSFPLVDLIGEASYSWRTRRLDFAGETLELKMRDMAISATAVYPVEVAFATAYGGVGIGSHSISYEYLRPLSLSLSANGIAIPETSTYFGYHGLVGARAVLPGFPFGVFAQYRINSVNSPGDNISYNSWSGGIYLSLP